MIIAKYKFNSTLYADLIPEFNAEFTNYTVTDEATETDSEGNVIKTRVIEHDTLLPTMMRFGILSNPGVRESPLTEIISINTSNINDMTCMFYGCINVTSINTSDWDTSKVTSMNSLFCLCTSLTSIDVSNFDTSKVTDMSYMFSMYSITSKLTTIIGLDKLNTSNVKYMNCMFYLSTKLTSLDVSNFDTKNVTNMSWMFCECNNLTSLDVSNFDTSNVTTMHSMFYNCKNLTSLDVSNFDTSNVTDMNSMFANCYKLTQLDVSNWDTSNVTSIYSIFFNCNKLINLDLSDWNTTNFTNLESMFNGCQSLQNLDISNFKLTSSMNIKNLFYNISSGIKNIGMLYCDKDTINLISSALGTITNRTIWVEGGMIDDLTSYDNVTYKAYYWEKEVLLNSPLLEGDKIVKKDGKIYHYHKMGMITFDGSEDDWSLEETDYGIGAYRRYTLNFDMPGGEGTFNLKVKSILYSNLLPHISEEQYTKTPISGISSNYAIGIKINNVSNLDGLKQWLQENPLTVVYELANPYYELISDTSDDLSLPLLSEDNIISNNSLIPTNMNVKNNGMSTVAMQSSTKYTVAFDKDTDSSVTVNLCGSTIDTTDNVVEITTPSELANDEITFIGDCEVSNVRILEGSVSGDAIPKESFEGLRKDSFEDSKLPENLLDSGEIVSGNSKDYQVTNLEVGKQYTVKIHATHPENQKFLTVGLVNPEGTQWRGNARLGIGDSYIGTDLELVGVFTAEDDANRFRINIGTDINKLVISELYLLEGDWTHLSEEDWNNLGKYKVEYKVIGISKNKFDKNNILEGYDLSYGSTTENIRETEGWFVSDYIPVFPGKDYKLSNAGLGVYYYDSNKKWVQGFNTNNTSFTIPNNIYYLKFNGKLQSLDIIQLEEGTVATEYEPYKGYTKTFYLNSPLLEGDTIEDVNGVATHVKRMGKVVLDENSVGESIGNVLDYINDTSSAILFRKMNNNIIDCFSDNLYSDKLPTTPSYLWLNSSMHNGISYVQEGWSFCMRLEHTNTGLTKSSSVEEIREGFKQWLQANPTTVVYELASPQYEPISTESILCDSYVNGHLDFDTNVPIEKVQFSRTPNISTKYLYPNTPYVLQFESDNIGKLNLSLANCYTEVDIIKGVNKISLPLADIPHNYLVLNGIGFNASNIQVVATDRDNIGYFKGIQSSFEDCVVEDETNENYGKYEVKVTLEDENGVISNEFIYLNSPLLKGDRIEMYNGKLCHYHKMGMVVLDGSEDEDWNFEGKATSDAAFSKIYRAAVTLSDLPDIPWARIIKNDYSNYVMSDKFISKNITSENYNDEVEHFSFWDFKRCVLSFNQSNLTEESEECFREWLSKKPITLTYTLAEPYYEDITPIQNEFVITSIGESSFTIDSGAIPTDGEITYSVNVKLLNDLEESINNNTSSTDTDLSTILDDIINE